jgi:hypothetical protein
MKFANVVLIGVLAFGLLACGNQAENQATNSTAEAQSSDPRYQNGLLNVNPQQFDEILADCGKLLFGEHIAPDEVQLKCRQDMIARASSMGITITEAHIGEQLVKDRYHFMQREQGK